MSNDDIAQLLADAVTVGFCGGLMTGLLVVGENSLAGLVCGLGFIAAWTFGARLDIWKGKK